MRCFNRLFCYCFITLLMQGCANAPSTPPVGSKNPAVLSVASSTSLPGGTLVPSVAPTAASFTPMAASGLVSEVFLYSSPVTQAYFAKGGVDIKVGIRIWEVFLRKYKIPFRLISTLEQLEQVPSGLLLLPSTVALSGREKQAIIGFRAKGGSVLATWLSGVRNEAGEWVGFGFMDAALDVKVVGNTEADEGVTYLIPYGDNPVTHDLPAGQRVWLERAKEWYPLRLVGRQQSAQVMDWARTFSPDKPSATLVFDEKVQASGRSSRSVVFGYPERLWLSADPRQLEAIAYNAIKWLLRQPDIYLSAWPHPYSSALVMVVDSTDVVVNSDLNFSKMVETAGGKATYFILSENAGKSAEVLKKIHARGHEIAFLGDRFDGFSGQPAEVQVKRLDSMLKVTQELGFDTHGGAGFHPPMDSYDKTTEKLLKERAFGYFVTSNGVTDSRLPFLPATEGDALKSGPMMVALPRTQIGPEDAMEEGDPEMGLQSFLSELSLAEDMAGISLIRVPNQSLLTPEQLVEIFDHLKARQNKLWVATGRQVADWWRQRSRIDARLDAGAAGQVLTVTIHGDTPLTQKAMVWVNLPNPGDLLQATPVGKTSKSISVTKIDTWRSAILLEGLSPGAYQWSLTFSR
jgi:hypothetical protein